MVQSPIPVYLPVITQAYLHSTNHHQNLHGHYEILQHHDSQHIAVIVSSEPLRKPVWKLQACMFEPGYII